MATESPEPIERWATRRLAVQVVSISATEVSPFEAARLGPN